MSLRNFIRTKDFRKHLLRIALIYLGIILVVWIYMAWYTDHGEQISVPDLKGMSISEAAELLDGLDLSYVVVDSVYSEKATGGTVMEQSPAQESKVKGGREIFLTLFRVQPPMETINIEEGEYAAVAMIKLTNKGIRFRKVEEPNSQMVGAVIKVLYKGKRLKPGTQIQRGDEVVIHVGISADEEINVPNLVGIPLDSAIAILDRSELTLGLTVADPPLTSRADSAAARVCRQTPGYVPEYKIKKGQVVDIWVSTQPCVGDSLPD
ncbi:MAG: hypothetical protein RL220_1050 [Bacteroidota bacterium]